MGRWRRQNSITVPLASSSKWRIFAVLPPGMLVAFVLLILLLHQHKTDAFSNSPCQATSLLWPQCSDGGCSWRTSSPSFSVDTRRYQQPNYPCNAHCTRRHTTSLHDKPKGKEPEKSKVPPKQTKSVLQNFFSSSEASSLPPPPPKPEEEKSSSWRNIFRRGNKDGNDKDSEKEKSTKRKKVASKVKSSSSSLPSKTRKQTVEKNIIKSDKLRQKAAEKEEKTKRPTSTQKKESRKEAKLSTEKVDEDEDQSLWNRVTGWLPGKGSPDDAEKVNESNSGNSTNPISAVQQFWQDSMARRAEEWIDVIPKTRLSPGEVVPVTVGGLDLLIIAGLTSDNRIYAIANSCPHLGTPLEVGQLVRLPKEANPGVPSDTIVNNPKEESANRWTELQVSSLLQQDGCEDCIVCPLHKTAFALESGQVRGEWCPYPPVVGKLTSMIKDPTPVATFDVRVRKKNIQVRLNSLLPFEPSDKSKEK